MAIELKVPEVGESITDVQIGTWLKQQGELVRRDEPLVSIETDKVTVELPAPEAGTIVEILVGSGEAATVGQVIGRFEAGASAPASFAGMASSEASSPKSAATGPAVPVAVEAAARPEPASTSPGYARVMPSARRALRERGLAAEEVTPSGPGGRVLKADVLRHELPPIRAARPAALGTDAGDRSHLEEVVAMSPLRRRIAERLVEAQQSAALLTTFNEVDMSSVMQLRQKLQERFQSRYAVKLGLMSFFVKAAVEALKLVPQVNAEVRGAEIVYRNYFDIGVAIGGGRGLVVPILRHAERLGFAEIEKTINDFATRAKQNQIRIDELTGGTFTISNGGIYGSMLSTPIVNPPQSGILGLHAIQDRPVAHAGQVVIRPMMYVALTYDHRLVDGREAVTFLKHIKECIEDPARILLEV